VFTKFYNYLKYKKEKDSLRDRFELLELQAKQQDSDLSTTDNRYGNQQQLKNDQSNDGFIFEEEVPWWEDSNKFDEIAEGQMLKIDYSKALEMFRASELYLLVGNCESLKIESLKNSNETSLLVTWNSDFLDLSSRRKYIEEIKKLKTEFKRIGIEVSVIHNHRRLGISDNIGVKIQLVQVNKKQEVNIVNENGASLL